MPGHTTNFDLPYPVSTDEPCDFAEQWCDFTDALDDVFTGFQVTLGRTMPVVPLAIMEQTIQRSVANNAEIPFDTVLADTAGMTDIDSDLYHITIQRPGRYVVAAGLQKLTVGAPFVTAFTGISATGKFSAQAMLYDRGAGITYFLNAYHTVETYAAGDKVGLSYSVGTQNFFLIDASWLAVIWHSDTEAP